MLKRGTYIGDEGYLQGEMALVMTVGEKAPSGVVPEGKVMIQANSVWTGLGFGWHEFPAEDWEIEVITP